MTCELPVFSGQEVGQKSRSALRRANFYSHVVRRVKEKDGRGWSQLPWRKFSEELISGYRLLIKDWLKVVFPRPNALVFAQWAFRASMNQWVLCVLHFFLLQMGMLMCLSCLSSTIVCRVRVEKVIFLFSSHVSISRGVILIWCR